MGLKSGSWLDWSGPKPRASMLDRVWLVVPDGPREAAVGIEAVGGWFWSRGIWSRGGGGQPVGREEVGGEEIGGEALYSEKPWT
jgi:hypothetical protein